MPTLKLTEEDQALLVLLSPEQRDAVILSLIRGEPEEGMSEGTMAVYCGIKRRERERLMTNERVKRYDRKMNRKNDRKINIEINGKSYAPPSPSPVSPLVPPSLPPAPPISPPYNPPTTPTTPPRTGEAPAGAAPTVDAKKSFGANGWVKLTESEYNRLLNDLGQDEVKRCIAYVDESAQITRNKNKWRDWNLVVRKCHRDGWGLNAARPAAPKAPHPSYGPEGEADRRAREDMERMRRIMQEGKL